MVLKEAEGRMAASNRNKFHYDAHTIRPSQETNLMISFAAKSL